MPVIITGLELISQYVFDVIDYSSQYGSKESTERVAANIVGPPKVYPRNAPCNATFSFRTYGSWWCTCPSALKPIISPPDGYTSNDYVDLFFDVPVVPTRLQIFETHNPGSVVRITACYRSQPSGSPVNARQLRWSTLWSAEPHTIDSCHRTFARMLRQLPPPISADNEPDRRVESSALQLATLERHPQHSRLSNTLRANLFDEVGYFRQTFGHHCLGQFRWSRIFQPTLENVPPYPTDLIRIEFDGSRCGHFCELDAVRLTGWAAVPKVIPSVIASPTPTLADARTPSSRLRWPGLAQFQGSSEKWPPDVSTLMQHFSALSPSLDAAAFFIRLLRACPPRIQLSVQQLPQPSNSHLALSSRAGSSSSLSLDWPYRHADNHEDPSPTWLPHQRHLSNRRNLAISCSSVKRDGLDTAVRCGSQLAITAYKTDDNLQSAAIQQQNRLIVLAPTPICPDGQFTGLPYEILSRIFDYFDVKTLLKVAQLSRLFRLLADDALSRLTSLNLQAHWAQLTDPALLSLGKRLGRVDLTTCAAMAVLTNRGANSVTPYLHLRRQDLEEVRQFCFRNTQHSPRGIGASVRRQLAARVRSWSSSAAEVLNSGGNRVSGTFPDEHGLPDIVDGDMSLPGVNRGDFGQPLPAELVHAAATWPVQPRLKRLDMSWCGNYSQISPTAFGHFLTDACRRLTTLRLSSCKFLNDDCLLYIINTCQHLQELDLSSCVGISASGFLILGRLIDLRWLSVYNTKIDDSGLRALADWCQHLRHLDAGACTAVEAIDSILDHLTRNNPYLLSINLWRCSSLTAVGVQHVARSCASSIEELDLGWCLGLEVDVFGPAVDPFQQHQEEVGNNCIRQLVTTCHGIKKLFLAGTNLLHSDDLLYVADQLGDSLEQLDISGSANITFASVFGLLTKCRRLRLLDVSFCGGPEDDWLSWHRIVQLRYWFPQCTLIASTRTMDDYEDDEMTRISRQLERIIDDEANSQNQQEYFNPFRYYLNHGQHHRSGDPFINRLIQSHALPGSGNLLALPAPSIMPAIDAAAASQID